MTITIIIEIFAFAYLLIICAVYFSRRKAHSFENYLYASLLSNNFIQLILEFSATFLIKDYAKYPMACIIVNKAYMIGIGLYIIIMSYYINCSFGYKEGEYEKKISFYNMCFSILLIGLSLMIILLPITFNHEIIKGMEQVYVSGAGVASLMVFAFVFIIIDLINLIISKTNNKHDAIVAWILLIICTCSIVISRLFFPGITVLYALVTLANIVMFFIIQNPDVVKVAQLNSIRKEASKYNDQKTEFLSNMSHEIRTALDIVQILSKDIIDSNESDEVKDEVKDILDASDNLLEVIGNILDINKIESNSIQLNNVNYDLKKELSSIAKMNAVKISTKPINFIVNIDNDIPDSLYGDKVKLKQVLNNLLSNAFKYTEEGKVILNIRGEVTDNICKLTVEVKDTGIGIKDPKRLFVKFDRMDIDKTSKIEGTGLGLVITRDLIQFMGGNLEVESTYGEGSKFSFTIDQKVSEEENNVNKTYQYNFDLIGKKVIICDDNLLSLNASRKFFSRYNIDITTCKSGSEVINNIRSNKYDLILLDVFMAEMDGIETLKNIRKFNQYIPVIALTADALSDSKHKYIQAGFDDYISKPVNKNEVDEVFSKLFKE